MQHSMLVWVVEVEARSSDGHHAGINDGKLSCCNGSDVDPSSERPCVHSLTKPVSFAIRPKRVIIDPSPPAPFLFTLDSRPSAGCEMVAAATPATTPEANEVARTPDLLIFSGDVPMALNICSATFCCTANFAMVYGICLNSMGAKPAYKPFTTPSSPTNFLPTAIMPLAYPGSETA